MPICPFFSHRGLDVLSDPNDICRSARADCVPGLTVCRVKPLLTSLRPDPTSAHRDVAVTFSACTRTVALRSGDASQGAIFFTGPPSPQQLP